MITGAPPNSEFGVETVRVVEPLSALVDPLLHRHTPVIREAPETGNGHF
jgi:hypothetical protein